MDTALGVRLNCAQEESVSQSPRDDNCTLDTTTHVIIGGMQAVLALRLLTTQDGVSGLLRRRCTTKKVWWPVVEPGSKPSDGRFRQPVR